MTDWEYSPEAEQELLAKQRESQLTRRFLNRQEVISAVKSLDAFIGEDGLEPPAELVEEANPELHRFLGEVAGYHLNRASLVELQHPLSGVVTQVAMEHDRLLVSQKEPKEELRKITTKRRDPAEQDEPTMFLRKVRFQELDDGTFRHADAVRMLEDESEFQHSITYEHPPVTRMEMVSMLSLLIESSVTRRDE